ncbi:hypothetical protein Agabi119p4_8030 [Agaricus bisporus var. burnettii]|uniref:Uncharacterized protein n=1 Tax=Agaricus bisporus var. burnettii TaxID=192524 RepID=A0A8H7C778_AGABI|nr:hypothetical protein Agabi119p4_8030 [Agaricus bisporus var. burnettii]
MSDNDSSDTLSTISTTSSLTSSDRLDSPPPYSPGSPRIYADSKLSDFGEDVDESLSSTLISSSATPGPSVSSPSSSTRHISPVRSSPKKMKKTNHKATHERHEHERTKPSPRSSNDYRSSHSSPRARPPRVHPPHSPIAPSPPPHAVRSSFPPNPPPTPPSFPPPIPGPPPPPNMYMGTNSWTHPGQGFSVHQSASPFGASQSINFHAPSVMPPQRFAPHNQHMNFSNNMGMSGMEEMRHGMENMRRTMQHDMEQMRNSMQFNMNSAFHGHPHRQSTSRPPRRDHNTGNMVVIGNQTYVPDRPHGTVNINNTAGRGGSGGSRVSVNGNGVQVGQTFVGWGSGPGAYALSVSSTGGGQAVSQTYVGSDGSRQSYNSYQGV